MSDINLLPEEKRREKIEKRPEKSEIEMTKPLEPIKGKRPAKKEKPSPGFFDSLKRLWDRAKKELKPEASKIIKKAEPSIKRPKKIPRPAMIVSEEVFSKEPWAKKFFSRFFKKNASSSMSIKSADSEDKSRDRSKNGLANKFKKEIFSPEMEVNLLPEEISVAESIKRQKSILLSTFIISVLLICSLYLGVFIYQSKIATETKTIEEKILKIEKEIKEYEQKEKEPEGLREKVDTINNLLKKHIYWTKFFALLEKYTIPEVAYLGFSAKQGESIILQAKAKDYKALARQFVTFQEADDFVKNVSITSASQQEDGEESVVSFSITLELKPGVFYKN